jgi:hypothetical protein
VTIGAAVQAMLVGMPAPQDLHRSEVDGQVVIAVGARRISPAEPSRRARARSIDTLFSYAADDAGLRNLAAVTLPELGFTGRRVGPARCGPGIWPGHVPGAGRGRPTRRSGNVWACTPRRLPGRWLASSGQAR